MDAITLSAGNSSSKCACHGRRRRRRVSPARSRPRPRRLLRARACLVPGARMPACPASAAATYSWRPPARCHVDFRGSPWDSKLVSAPFRSSAANGCPWAGPRGAPIPASPAPPAPNSAVTPSSIGRPPVAPSPVAPLAVWSSAWDPLRSASARRSSPRSGNPHCSSRRPSSSSPSRRPSSEQRHPPPLDATRVRTRGRVLT
jgi:hypothetical protein